MLLAFMNIMLEDMRILYVKTAKSQYLKKGLFCIGLRIYNEIAKCIFQLYMYIHFVLY